MLNPEHVTRSTIRWVCRVRIHDALFIARQGYNSLHLMRRKTCRLCANVQQKPTISAKFSTWSECNHPLSPSFTKESEIMYQVN